MPLEEADRAEISQMIADAVRSSSPPPRATPTSTPPPSQGDWDKMSERDRQSWVRTTVEEHLASLDAAAELRELKDRNKQLEAERAEWEKGGKRGPRPQKPADDKREEAAPSLVSAAYKWLFGDATTQAR